VEGEEEQPVRTHQGRCAKAELIRDAFLVMQMKRAGNAN
jgi:hypothetical protein